MNSRVDTTSESSFWESFYTSGYRRREDGFRRLAVLGPYDCTGTTRCSTEGRPPLMGPPMLWRVLRQPGPLDQGIKEPDVLGNLSHGWVTDFFR